VNEPAFVEIADRIYLLRHPVLDVNVTLVVGTGAALVVDTLSTATQATSLVAAARRVTSQPWAVVNTHHHFDHAFGNAVVAGSPPCPIWAHEAAAARLAAGPAVVAAAAAWATHTDRRLAAELAVVTVLPPSHLVQIESTVDVGGRPVVLRHFGRAHTDGDLVVHVPDVDLVVAGDIVEESGPPSFDDSYPLEWPETLARLLRMMTPETVVIPGHGVPVGHGFVTGQHQELAALEWLIRDAHGDGAPQSAAAAHAPFGPKAARAAIARGYAELSGAVT
jgi:glyoxylase-like metal-dependent hydrolase (beta-lactamase superfamily II)